MVVSRDLLVQESMCGINGIFVYGQNGVLVDIDELKLTRDSMRRRGPDSAGIWCSNDWKVGLGHRRLSIIDLTENGSQPMSSPDGHLRVVFNGEIYNYRAIRKCLERDGAVFHSATDTEVLLHLYERYGTRMVEKLRGMYAFAIWDERKRELILARDPFGIKPLYYSDQGRVFRFASQVKALLSGKSVDSSPDPAGHVGFYLWGNVPEPYTLYAGVKSVEAGEVMVVSESRGVERVPAPRLSSGDESRLESEDLHQVLLDAVKHHFVADVPVGIFLSSGIDSCTLLALATELGYSNIHTVTLGFREYVGTDKDEAPLAERIATIFHSDHETRWISATEFKDGLDGFFEAMDQPTIDGLNMFLVSKVASLSGLKVSLSGAGADELFGGYANYQRIPRMVRALSGISRIPGAGRIGRELCRRMPSRFVSPKSASLVEFGGTYAGAYLLCRGLFMPWELSSILDPDLVQQGMDELNPLERLEEAENRFQSPQAKVTAMEQTHYLKNQLLRDSDWAGMHHSIEIRVPFVDISVQSAVEKLILAGKIVTKGLLARSGSQRLPDELLIRKKTGFNVPVQLWTPSGGDVKGRGLRNWAQFVYGKYAHAGN